MVGVGERGGNSIHPKARQKTFAERKCDAVSLQAQKRVGNRDNSFIDGVSGFPGI